MLANETVLVTGATSGFGRKIAVICSSHGAKVIAIGRRGNLLDELKSSLPGRNIVTAIHDVVNETPEDLLERKIPDSYKNITVLVNNAGLSIGFDKFHLGNLNDFEIVVDTNIKSIIKMTYTVLQGMLKRKSGYIINIGSVAGNHSTPSSNVYGGTKAFIKMFSSNLRADLHGTGLRITNIEPGLAETEFSLVRFKGNKYNAREVYKGNETANS